MSKRLKFVSYTGEWPTLCMGTLILSLDGEDITFPPFCLESGGDVWFGKDWSGHITKGPWCIVKFPEALQYDKALQQEAVRLVNENVDWGCCGGCL